MIYWIKWQVFKIKWISLKFKITLLVDLNQAYSRFGGSSCLKLIDNNGIQLSKNLIKFIYFIK